MTTCWGWGTWRSTTLGWKSKTWEVGAGFGILGAVGIILYCLVVVVNQNKLKEPPAGWRTSGAASVIINEEHPYVLPSLNVPETGRALIHAIKERARIAAGGELGYLTAEEEAEWNRRNSCQSRLELLPLYSLRKYAKDLPANPLWDELFREYSNYHRTCMAKIDNVTRYFIDRDNSTTCDFVVADVGELIGVGNKLQVVGSIVLYAILTQRVVLVPAWHLVPSLTCEPFPGSTWLLESDFPIPPQNFENYWEMSSKFQPRIDSELQRFENNCTEGKATPCGPLSYASGDHRNEKQPFPRFFCSTEQFFYSKLKWMYFGGCIYTIPKLFGIPRYRPTLEALFPDKVVLTRVFRSALLPADSVFSRVRRTYEVHLQPAERRVGIQVRYRFLKLQYADMHKLINKRVTDCVLENGFLPEVNRSADSESRNTSAPIIKVFITSLFQSVTDHLTKMYMRFPTVTGERVGVIQMTHDLEQRFGAEEDIQAFAEIILLSLSDHLLVTPISTFGGSAQTYGALTPWYVEYRKDGPASCERAKTAEVCNQYTRTRFDCRYDPDLDQKLFSEVVPYIKDCLDIELKSVGTTGIQLMTTFQS